MRHGLGEEEWITQTYEKKRRLALEWRFRYDDDDLEDLEITGSQGGGKHYSLKNRVMQYPFPYSYARSKKYINIRYHPRVG